MENGPKIGQNGEIISRGTPISHTLRERRVGECIYTQYGPHPPHQYPTPPRSLWPGVAQATPDTQNPPKPQYLAPPGLGGLSHPKIKNCNNRDKGQLKGRLKKLEWIYNQNN